MSPLRVAINGFGRIGRSVCRIVDQSASIDIVAINDLIPPSHLAHLLKYDSVRGIFQGQIEATERGIILNKKGIQVINAKDPEHLPWAQLGIDVVLEASGKFTRRESAKKHLLAGAERVLISAPGHDPDLTVCMGINEEQYNPDNHQILSNTSCTANCLVPLVQVLWHQFGIIKGMINTVHCCTNNQALLDTPHKDLRRARATGLSMIPTSTGAAEAVSEILPYMKGKLSEIAVRVPTASVSLIDLVIETEKNTDRQQVNDAFKSFESGSLRNILGVCEAPLVSADFVGSHLSCTIDALSTEVLGGNMVRVLAWYDNEWGYSNRIVDLLHYMEAKRTENALAS